MGKVAEYRFVRVLSLLYVVFIEFAGDDDGDESGGVTLRASTFVHLDGMFLDVVTTMIQLAC